MMSFNNNGLIENILYHIFNLVPYVIKDKNKTIKFYGSITSCQDLDRFIANVELERLDYTFNRKKYSSGK